MRILALVLSVAWCAMLAPSPVEAHGSPFGENGRFYLPDHVLHVRIGQGWVFVGGNVTLEARVYDLRGQAAPNATVAVSFTNGTTLGPFGMRAATDDGGPLLRHTQAFPHKGEWTVRLEVRDGALEGSASDTMTVYPRLAWFVAEMEPMDRRVGETATIPLAVRRVDGTPPAPEVTDLRVRVERYGAVVEEVEARPVSPPWQWEVTTTWRDPGEHRLRFASQSGGFGFQDIPPAEVDVLEAGAAAGNGAPTGSSPSATGPGGLDGPNAPLEEPPGDGAGAQGALDSGTPQATGRGSAFVVAAIGVAIILGAAVLRRRN